MTAIKEVYTTVIRANSVSVSSGGAKGDTRVDIDNDGKVDFVLHHSTQTISFSKQFLKDQPMQCTLIARNFPKFHVEGRVRASDQRAFDIGKNSARPLDGGQRRIAMK